MLLPSYGVTGCGPPSAHGQRVPDAVRPTPPHPRHLRVIARTAGMWQERGWSDGREHLPSTTMYHAAERCCTWGRASTTSATSTTRRHIPRELLGFQCGTSSDPWPSVVHGGTCGTCPGVWEGVLLMATDIRAFLGWTFQ